MWAKYPVLYRLLLHEIKGEVSVLSCIDSLALWIDICWLLIDVDNQTDECKIVPSQRNQNY